MLGPGDRSQRVRGLAQQVLQGNFHLIVCGEESPLYILETEEMLRRENEAEGACAVPLLLKCHVQCGELEWDPIKVTHLGECFSAFAVLIT